MFRRFVGAFFSDHFNGMSRWFYPGQFFSLGSSNLYLIRHQETGVEFIVNREDSAFCDRVASELLALTHLQNTDTLRPKTTLSPCLGGIVADVMGLGKTLTMLSAIIYLKSDAKKFAQINNEGSMFTSTGATLVVVTSRRKSFRRSLLRCRPISFLLDW